jgi:hypothetical protein
MVAGTKLERGDRHETSGGVSGAEGVLHRADPEGNPPFSWPYCAVHGPGILEIFMTLDIRRQCTRPHLPLDLVSAKSAKAKVLLCIGSKDRCLWSLAFQVRPLFKDTRKWELVQFQHLFNFNTEVISKV